MNPIRNSHDLSSSMNAPSPTRPEIKIKSVFTRVVCSHLVQSLALIGTSIACTALVLTGSQVGIIPLVCAMALAFLIKNRKILLYEISLCFTLMKRQAPFNKIDHSGNTENIGNIYLGKIPLKNRGDHEALKAININCVLALLEDFELSTLGIGSEPVAKEDWEALGITPCQIQSQDYLPVSRKNIEFGVVKIHEAVSQNKNIYVHCKAGRGRSATVVICYFIKHCNMSVDDAITRVKYSRLQIHLNPRQREAISDFERSNSNKSSD